MSTPALFGDKDQVQELKNINKTPNKNTKNARGRPRGFTRPLESPMIKVVRQLGEFVDTINGKISKNSEANSPCTKQ